MKFNLVFKTPDILGHLDRPNDWFERETIDEMKRFAEKFLIDGESINIWFDTEAGTAIALRQK